MTIHTVTDEDIGTLFDRHARAVYNHAFRLTGSWSGVGYPEAAAVLGISETAVRSRVSRARSRLTRLLAIAVPEEAK